MVFVLIISIVAVILAGVRTTPCSAAVFITRLLIMYLFDFG